MTNALRHVLIGMAGALLLTAAFYLGSSTARLSSPQSETSACDYEAIVGESFRPLYEQIVPSDDSWHQWGIRLWSDGSYQVYLDGSFAPGNIVTSIGGFAKGVRSE